MTIEPGSIVAHLCYALAWATFGLGHSILAAESVKTRLAGFLGNAYRLAYNIFALVHVGAIWWLGRGWIGNAGLGLPEPVAITGDGLMVLGALVILVAATRYDGGRFLGLTQLFRPAEPPDEALRIDGPHRYVRHPAYSGLFLVLWGHAQTEFALATALWASFYLLIGAAFEERRLIALYGDAYVRYRARVPAYIPWRGRVEEI